MSHLVRLATDLVALDLLAYPRGSEIGFGATRQCSRNQPTRYKKHDRLQPRCGARAVRVVSVRRNVRMYAPDLVKTAESWATRPPAG